MSDSRLLRGTLILTAATFISKFLGMIYIFPFYALLDAQGTALYTYAYVPYSILISIATMGVPLAVSKFVSKYNALGDYETGRKMLRSGMLLMSATGVIAFLLLYMAAPLIAPIVIGENPTGNSYDDVTFVIRMVSFALLIVPMMSLVRGFFQGYSRMEPTAISQVIEQIIRIVFILLSSYLVIKVFDGTIRVAVGLSTFAAFIGALGGLAALYWFWKKSKPEMQQFLQESTVTHDMPVEKMYLELLTYAGPFVFVGLAIPLYQLVDQFTFNRAMISIGLEEIAEQAFSMLNFSSNKLVMIPVSLSTAFALTLIPTITKSFTENNIKLLHKQISQTLQTVMLLTLPAVIGLSTVAYPAYAAFFSIDDAVRLGGEILQQYAPVALLFAFFTVTAAILQGINQQRFAVIALFSGFLLKLITNVLFIKLWGTTGSIVATAIGYVTAIAINLWAIKKYTQFSYSVFFRRSLLIVIFTVIMSITVTLIEFLLTPVVDYTDGRIQSFVILTLSVAAGIAIYLWLCMKSGLAKYVLGEKISTLLKKRKPVVEAE